jgi:hypothetical protein
MVDRIQIAMRWAAKSIPQIAGNDVTQHPGYRSALVYPRHLRFPFML